MFSNEEFTELRKDMGEALKPLAEKYGIHIKVGKISYSNTDATIKVEIAKKDPDGKSMEQAEFERLCSIYGFEPKDYLMSFTDGGRNFVLIGFNPNARSMPYLGRESKTGKLYKFRRVVLGE